MGESEEKSQNLIANEALYQLSYTPTFYWALTVAQRRPGSKSIHHHPLVKAAGGKMTKTEAGASEK
jgi:hypothetical protein